MPGTNFLQDKVKAFVPPAFVQHCVPDLQTIGRHVRKQRYIEVSVQNDCERSRYRRRTHDKNRDIASLSGKCLPLPHAETMLLVGNDKPEVLVIYFLLYKCMGADDDVRRTIRDFLQSFSSRGALHRSRQQNRIHPEMVFLLHGREVLHVLLCEHFGRRHQGPLSAVRGGEEKRKKGKDCFAGTHIALQQAVHQPAAAKIAPDFLPGFLLRIRELIGKLLDQSFRVRGFNHRPRIDPFLFLILPLGDVEQEKEKFIERKPVPCLGLFLFILRKMDGPGGTRFGNKPKCLPCSFVQELRPVCSGRDIVQIDFLKDVPDSPDYEIVLKPLRKRVPGLPGSPQFLILIRPKDLRLLKIKIPVPVLFEHTPEHMNTARLQCPLEIRLVEKRKAHLPAGVSGGKIGH